MILDDNFHCLKLYRLTFVPVNIQVQVVDIADYESTLNLKIYNGRSNTTSRYVKICFIRVKIRWFSRSLITNFTQCLKKELDF